MLLKLLTLSLGFFLLVGCSDQVQFSKVKRVSPYGIQSAVEFYSYNGITDTFNQSVYDTNKVSLDFQVFDSNGIGISQVKKDDISIFENALEVDNFSFSKKSSSSSSSDIILVIDVTASMNDEIASVKQNVSDFVDRLASANIVANLCLITFDDQVRRKCLKFSEDNPATTDNENLIQV